MSTHHEISLTSSCITWKDETSTLILYAQILQYTQPKQITQQVPAASAQAPWLPRCWSSRARKRWFSRTASS